MWLGPAFWVFFGGRKIVIENREQTKNGERTEKPITEPPLITGWSMSII